MAPARETAYNDLGFAVVDVDRARRQGVPEVVLAPGKTDDQLVAVIRALLAEPARPVLVTRLAPDVAGRVAGRVRGAVYDERGRVMSFGVGGGSADRVAIITAGTSDGPVAEEAAAVLSALGIEVDRVDDVGVAGIHRLRAAQPALAAAGIVVVIAGMDAALASVVGGLVAVPVIAVPTSTGYGAAFDGLAALLSMLSSCAAGVTVVNIDNGFGAAMAAWRLIHTRTRPQPPV